MKLRCRSGSTASDEVRCRVHRLQRRYPRDRRTSTRGESKRCQPRIERQCSFEPTVGFVKAVRQHGAPLLNVSVKASFGARSGLMCELAGPLPIEFGGSAEAMGHVGPGTRRGSPSATQGRDKFLRPAEFVQSDARIVSVRRRKQMAARSTSIEGLRQSPCRCRFAVSSWPAGRVVDGSSPKALR